MGKFRIVKSKKQYPDPAQTFDQFYSMWADDLHRIAFKEAWKFRRADPSEELDECKAELHHSFWLAYLYWRPAAGDFGKFFWSIWLNRIATVVRHHSAAKRLGTTVELTESTEVVHSAWHPSMSMDEFQLLHLPLFQCHPMERPIITMLAQGFSPAEVKRSFGHRLYHEVIEVWKEHYINSIK